MVNSKIHIICGNCGCNDEWTLLVDAFGDEVFDDYGDVIGRRPLISLSCGNCTTSHFLKEDLMKREDT